MQSKQTKIILPLVMSLVLAACSERHEALIPLIQGRTGLGDLIDLKDTDWKLERLNDRVLLPNTNITLEFDETTAGGFAGCNSYGGSYTVTVQGGLRFSDVAMTEMACLSPDGVMKQEQAFFTAILAARAFRANDGRLEITDAGGETVLLFDRRDEAGMDPTDLVGTIWRLRSWNGKSPLPGSTITIAFSATEISGSAGCRGYVGTYQANGDEIRILSNSMTDATVTCSPAVAEQEAEYTTALSWLTHYLLAENELKLFTARGEVLGFTK